MEQPFSKGLADIFRCLSLLCLLLLVVEQSAADTSLNCQVLEKQSTETDAYAGQRILDIRFVSQSVFDLSNPDENTRVYRLLNRLHRNTRQSVIQSQLLFKEGEAVSPDLLAESGRLLRSQAYLASAQVRIAEACAEGVIVEVITRDVWTTEPQITASREGDENKSGLALTEKNVAGTGNTVSISYLSTADRSEIGYDFFSPHIFNSRIALRVAHSDNSDGQNNIIEVQKPFYSLQTNWAVGFSSYDITQTERIRFLDETINRFQQESNRTEVFGGLKLYGNASAVHRAKIGATHDRRIFSERFDTVLVPEDFNVVSSWLEYEYLENRFAKYKNLNYLHRVEDVATGRQFRFRVGYGQDRAFNKEKVWTSSLRYSDVLSLKDDHLLSAAVQHTGFHYQESSNRNEQLYSAALEYFYLIDSNDRWYGRLQYQRGRNLRQHNELTIGGSEGLRGYPLDFLRGTEQSIFTLERRKVTDLHILNLLRVGILAFYEIGRVGGGPYENSFFLSDVGVGLRIASSKARVGNVVHIDWAYPLAKNDEIKSIQFTIKASQRF